MPFESQPQTSPIQYLTCLDNAFQLVLSNNKLKENGLDLKSDLIKVSAAAHYLNGGIKTNLNGETKIKGIYACGETAATGAHGDNRLASNSLIEGIVFGSEKYESI